MFSSLARVIGDRRRTGAVLDGLPVTRVWPALFAGSYRVAVIGHSGRVHGYLRASDGTVEFADLDLARVAARSAQTTHPLRYRVEQWIDGCWHKVWEQTCG